MKKYVFDKSIYLGLLKKSFNAGDAIELDENCVVINGEQINDLRDIKICTKKGYIVPFDGSRFDAEQEEVEKVEEKKEDSDTFFGFKVDREEAIGKSIPLSKFRPTVIDESKPFAEEDGQIVEATGIHVAPAQTKTEITSKTSIEPDEQTVEPLEVKKTAKKNTSAKAKTTKTTAKATTVKKATTTKTKSESANKKSKIDSNMSIETEKVEGSVRGMNIIKSE